MNTHYLLTLSLLGMALSFYALRVLRGLKTGKVYTPLCDVSKTITCSKVLGSKEGHVFGVSNASLGILFYFIIFLLSYFGQLFAVIYLSLVAVLFSLYLFFVMVLKLKKFCLVCTVAYLVNVCLLIFSFLAFASPA